MADERFFRKKIQSMSALGRNFKLGDLYNYHNDQILPGKKLIYPINIPLVSSWLTVTFNFTFLCLKFIGLTF